MIVNLTPHAINILDADGVELLTIPASGQQARARQQTIPAGEAVHDGVTVPVVQVAYGELEGLPDPDGATSYVVSALAAQAAARTGRITDDLLLTFGPVRDAAGRIVGVTGFARP